jgi:ribosomal protein S27E
MKTYTLTEDQLRMLLNNAYDYGRKKTKFEIIDTMMLGIEIGDELVKHTKQQVKDKVYVETQQYKYYNCPTCQNRQSLIDDIEAVHEVECNVCHTEFYVRQ